MLFAVDQSPRFLARNRHNTILAQVYNEILFCLSAILLHIGYRHVRQLTRSTKYNITQSPKHKVCQSSQRLISTTTLQKLQLIGDLTSSSKYSYALCYCPIVGLKQTIHANLSDIKQITIFNQQMSKLGSINQLNSRNKLVVSFSINKNAFRFFLKIFRNY